MEDFDCRVIHTWEVCKQFTDSDESFFHKQFCKAKLACDRNHEYSDPKIH